MLSAMCSCFAGLMPNAMTAVLLVLELGGLGWVARWMTGCLAGCWLDCSACQLHCPVFLVQICGLSQRRGCTPYSAAPVPMFLASSFKLMLPAQCVRVQRPTNQPAPAPIQAAPWSWPARNRQSCLPSACMSSAQLTNPPPCSHAGRPMVLASSFTFMCLVCTLGLGATAAFVVYYAIAG